jgi:hypothetical protein
MQQNARVDTAGYTNEVAMISRKGHKHIAYGLEPMRRRRSAH